MWIFSRRRSSLRDHLDLATAEAARHEALIARLCTENSELRAIVVELDRAVTDLSIQVWGRQAYDRAVENARRNGNN